MMTMMTKIRNIPMMMMMRRRRRGRKRMMRVVNLVLVVMLLVLDDMKNILQSRWCDDKNSIKISVKIKI